MSLINCDGRTPPTQYGHPNSYPNIAFDGEKFLIVWSNEEIYGRMLSSEGEFLTTRFTISEGKQLQVEPYVTYLDSTFFVVWEEHDNTDTVNAIGRAVSGSDAIDFGATIYFTPGNGLGQLACAKLVGGYFLAWKNWERYSNEGHLATFDSKGNLLIDRIIGINSAYPTQLERHAERDLFLVPNGVSASIYDSALVKIHTVDVPNGDNISCVFGNGRWCVASKVNSTSYYHYILGSVISEEGVLINTATLFISGRSFENYHKPTIAYGGEIFLSIWTKRELPNDTFYTRRISADGTFLDSEPDSIFVRGLTSDLRLSYGQNSFLLVWRESGSLFGCRLSLAGEMIDTEPFIISGAEANITPSITGY